MYGSTYVSPDPNGVAWATPSPSATADHAGVSGTTINIEVAPNATTGARTLLVDTHADNLDEPDETLEVAATAVNGTPATGGKASVTLQDWFYTAPQPTVTFVYATCPSTPRGVLEGGRIVNPNATTAAPVRYFGRLAGARHDRPALARLRRHAGSATPAASTTGPARRASTATAGSPTSSRTFGRTGPTR